MKALIYLAGFIAIGVFSAWVIYGLTPEQQLNRVKAYIQGASTEISSHVSDTASSATKLKNRLGSEFNEASDVYHGKEKEDPYKYNQAQ